MHVMQVLSMEKAFYIWAPSQENLSSVFATS